MEKKLIYGILVFNTNNLNSNEDYILKYPENLNVLNYFNFIFFCFFKFYNIIYF